jgi:hypothetical protein
VAAGAICWASRTATPTAPTSPTAWLLDEPRLRRAGCHISCALRCAAALDGRRDGGPGRPAAAGVDAGTEPRPATGRLRPVAVDGLWISKLFRRWDLQPLLRAAARRISFSMVSCPIFRSAS